MLRWLIAFGLVVALAMGPLVLAQDDLGTVEEGPSLLIVLEQVDVYGIDGALLGVAEPGDMYLILGMEGQWALVVSDREPDWPVWIGIDPRILVLAPVPRPPEPVEISTPIAESPLPTQVPTAVEIPTLAATAALPDATPTAMPTDPPVTATMTPSPSPTVTPTVESPSAWALTVADLPSGFTRQTSNTTERDDTIAHRAEFSRTVSSSAGTPVGSLVVPAFSETIALKQPLRGTAREYVDQLAEGQAHQLISSVGAGSLVSASGPSVGTNTRWLQATISNRADLHVVVFSVGNNFAIVGLGSPRGTGSQAEAARIANIVAGRMRA